MCCRRLVWEKNLDYIQKHNAEADIGLHSYTLGVNQFADLVSCQLVLSSSSNQIIIERISFVAHILAIHVTYAHDR